MRLRNFKTASTFCVLEVEQDLALATMTPESIKKMKTLVISIARFCWVCVGVQSAVCMCESLEDNG